MLETPSAFYADLGVSAEFDGLAIQVFKDVGGSGALDGLVSASEVVIQFPAQSWPGIKPGSAITVDAKSYTVRDVFPIDDAQHMRAILRRAA